MKNTVWVLTTGQYSDYGIEGIFSTKEKALEAGKYFSEINPPLEMTIDELWDNLQKKIYSVFMNEDGNSAKADIMIGSLKKDDLGRIQSYYQDRLHIYVKAEEEQYAIKIANEKRIMYLAAKK